MAHGADPTNTPKGIAPPLVTPGIENVSGAMFNKFGDAIEPSASVTDRTYQRKFMDASEELAARALATPPGRQGNASAGGGPQTGADPHDLRPSARMLAPGNCSPRR